MTKVGPIYGQVRQQSRWLRVASHLRRSQYRFMRTVYGILFFLSHLVAHGVPLIERTVEETPSIALKSVAKFSLATIPECSALWASPSQPGLFWTLSDSGAKPRISAIHADGTFVKTEHGLWTGVDLKGATNVDWEALTGDASGRMIVADVGNNVSRRKELALYVFQEPKVGTAEITDFKKYVFGWPDQTAFPDPELTHDCEAIFIFQGKIYLLTKHRRDTLTELWRAELPATGSQAVLTKISQFNAHGMVTDASLSSDGHRLAVLTYRTLWVFEMPAHGEDFFSGRAWMASLSPPLFSWQVEGCAWFDDKTLLLGSEQGDLFKVSQSELTEIK